MFGYGALGTYAAAVAVIIGGFLGLAVLIVTGAVVAQPLRKAGDSALTWAAPRVDAVLAWYNRRHRIFRAVVVFVGFNALGAFIYVTGQGINDGMFLMELNKFLMTVISLVLLPLLSLVAALDEILETGETA